MNDSSADSTDSNTHNPIAGPLQWFTAELAASFPLDNSWTEDQQRTLHALGQNALTFALATRPDGRQWIVEGPLEDLALRSLGIPPERVWLRWQAESVLGAGHKGMALEQLAAGVILAQGSATPTVPVNVPQPGELTDPMIVLSLNASFASILAHIATQIWPGGAATLTAEGIAFLKGRTASILTAAREMDAEAASKAWQAAYAPLPPRPDAEGSGGSTGQYL